jgi:Xaa-Pro aminopeptidase
MVASVNVERMRKGRIESARKVMKDMGLDALVVTAFDNVRWVTNERPFFVLGWEPNSMAVLGLEGDPVLLHAGKFVAPSKDWLNDGAALKKEFGWSHYSIYKPSLIGDVYAGWLKDALMKLGITGGTIGIDNAPWQWATAFQSELPNFRIVSADKAIMFARAVKNSEEQKLIRESGRVVADGILAGLKACKAGVREYDIYKSFMGAMYAEGSEGDAFFPFLVSGRGTVGELYPGNRVVKTGDPVIMDFGPIMGGYTGDCMRTAFIGTAPRNYKVLYTAVHEAVQAAIKTVAPGKKASDIDAKVREIFRRRGVIEHRFDSGHGVGLNCCELPILMKREEPVYDNRRDLDLTLQPGMVFSIEPRVWMKGTLGCGLEQIIMVTDSGAEVITKKAPYENGLLL